MKILLCIHDCGDEGQGRWQRSDPEEELAPHHVTTVHSYRDALRASANGPFDAMITSVALPRELGQEAEIYGVILAKELDRFGVKVAVILLEPEHTEASVMELGKSGEKVIATNKCRTMTGDYDWEKILAIIKFRIPKLKK